MKLAVIFPGIGYHTDKPLLYYSKKLAVKYGYEIAEVSYGGFSSGIRGSREKMLAAYESACRQAEEILRGVDFQNYEQLLFVSKSIGTAVAGSYASRHGLQTDNLFYTPVEASFDVIHQPGIAFHGTCDPWVETDIVKKGCLERNLPLYLTQGANHSLETGEVRTDLMNLQVIMEQTENYIKSLHS